MEREKALGAMLDTFSVFLRRGDGDGYFYFCRIHYDQPDVYGRVYPSVQVYNKDQLMTVALVFRKKNPLFFSIESVFDRIEKELRISMTVIRMVAPEKGISFRNIKALRSMRRTGPADVFHITGDIHYAIFGLPRRR